VRGMTTAEELRAAVEAARRCDTPELIFAREQQDNAPSGQAVGQCECGAYRLDGQPPVLHYPRVRGPQVA
jgi:hypothetical protein